MASVATRDSRGANPHAAYSTSWEHLSDEFQRLDLLIRLHTLPFQKERLRGPLEGFQGVVLTDEEIAGLLDEERAESTDQNPQIVDLLSSLGAEIAERRARSLQEQTYLSLPHLSQIFGLSPFEESVVLLCLAPEVDRKYEKLYAYLQDDVTRRKPSVDLALKLFCPASEERLAARRSFDSQAPLLRYRLIEALDSPAEGPGSLLSRFLRLDERIAAYLLGPSRMDGCLASLASAVLPRDPAEEAAVPADVKDRLCRYVLGQLADGQPGGKRVVFYLHGPYGSGMRALAALACKTLGVPLLVADLERALHSPAPFEELMLRLGREAVLQHAALCLENLDCLLEDRDKQAGRLKTLLDVTRDFTGLTFLCGAAPWNPHGLLEDRSFLEVKLAAPDARHRMDLWKRHGSDGRRLAEDVDLGALAGRFRFTSGQIRDALATARDLALWRSGEDRIAADDLYAACRAQATPRLGALATKIEPHYRWEDIVLPPDTLAQLREICNQAKYRHIVHGEWGFEQKLSLGKGLPAVFSGPPGTGKTMAAEVIANDLQLDLFKVDLSHVVSKYVGETEKNLQQVFDEAQAANVILFFDEADALFGKRSEVKDAHDRFANIEIAYLLQKMDEYEGIVILATNLRQHMDEAFLRRMQAIVEFPFPDEEYRRRIWESVFPRAAPLAEDADFAVLAREIKLAGGNIRNMALAAAFYAAAEGGRIKMTHLLQAAQREHGKLGRSA